MCSFNNWEPCEGFTDVWQEYVDDVIHCGQYTAKQQETQSSSGNKSACKKTIFHTYSESDNMKQTQTAQQVW